MVLLTAPDYLSPSSIATFQQCPLRYKYSRIDGLTEPPTQATIFGNFVHDILEHFYALEPAERTAQAARQIAAATWSTYESDVQNILRSNAGEIRSFRWRAWWCIENLMKMEDVNSVSFEGLETGLDAAINGVKVKGFVDRWSLDENGALVIGDYKTGKVPKPQYLGDKFDQLLIYGVILSDQLSKELGRIELLYITHSVRAEHLPTSEDVQRIKETVLSVRSQIDERCETGIFEPRKSPLCSWCHFKPMCPVWASKHK